MTQIGVEAATLIPPLAYRAVMMVVIAIPVVVGAVLVRTARPVHTYQSKTTPVAVGFGCWLVWAQYWSVGCAVATAFHGAQSLELCSRYHSRLRCWWELLLWVVSAFGSAVETSLVSCTPIAAAVARPAAAAELTDAALGPKSLGPAAPPAPDLASAPPWETDGVGGRVSSAASVTTVVFAAAVVAV